MAYSAAVARALPTVAFRVHARIVAFAALSLAAHLATLWGFNPIGWYSGGTEQQRPVVIEARLDSGLPATLTATHTAEVSTDQSMVSGGGSAIASEPAPMPSHRHADTQAGGSVAMPTPEKWYVASELDERAAPINLGRMEYPESLRGTNRSGWVRLRLYIDEQGTVQRMRVESSEPAGVFDEAARTTWGAVRFHPGRKDGVAVKSQKLLELQYLP